MIKNYTFKLAKNNDTISYNNSYNSYESSENYLKSIVANNLVNKYPTIFGSTYSVRPKTTVYYCDYKPVVTNTATIDWNFNSDYAKAIAIIDGYGKKYYGNTSKDEYDFEIDGVPVRIFGDMIQIGYKIFSKNADSNYYINLPSTTKKTIINIVINITKNNYKF